MYTNMTQKVLMYCTSVYTQNMGQQCWCYMLLHYSTPVLWLSVDVSHLCVSVCFTVTVVYEVAAANCSDDLSESMSCNSDLMTECT